MLRFNVLFLQIRSLNLLKVTYLMMLTFLILYFYSVHFQKKMFCTRNLVIQHFSFNQFLFFGLLFPTNESTNLK